MDLTTVIQEVWPEWQVVEMLGAGSYGCVYHAQRTDMVGTSHAAIKVVSIPKDESELKALQLEGYSEQETRGYIRQLANDFSNEVRLMDAVKGNTNIVSIEDHRVIQHPEIPQWFIVIRMELLTPLQRYLESHQMEESEIIKLGIDLCSALSVCKKRNIVHRDIKPENIFVNAFGDFKLGDFGVARSMERLTTNFTRTGTYNYMAPELFNNTLKGTGIDAVSKVDIYSLGMVLYVLSNNGRPAFFPTNATPSPEDRSQALVSRMQGKPLAAPVKASKGLSKIILKACAFKPENRFADANEMLAELIKLRDAPQSGALDTPILPRFKAPKRIEKRRFPLWMTILLGLSAASALMALIMFLSQPKKPSETEYAFSSPAIEAAARDALNRPDDPVYPSDIAGIKTLDLSGRGLTDIGDLAAFTGLSRLDLRDNDISDLAPLSALSGLESLDLSDNDVEDVAPLAGLEKLSRLDLSGNPGKDFSSVDFVANLVTPSPSPSPTPTPEPYVFENAVVEGSARRLLNLPTGALTKEQLSGITALDLSGTHISNIGDLAAFTGLEELDLSGNSIEDLSPLSELTALRTLDLANNRVSDVGPLSRLFELETLDLSGNDVEDVTPLAGLYQLNALDLTGNPTQDFSPVDFVEALVTPKPTPTPVPTATPTPSPTPTSTPTPTPLPEIEAPQLAFEGEEYVEDDIAYVTGDTFVVSWSNAPDTGLALGAAAELIYPNDAVRLLEIVDDSEVDIDTTELSPGVYTVRVEFSSGIYAEIEPESASVRFAIPEVDEPVSFADSRVESAALASLGLEEGPLYEEDLASVTKLDLGDTALTNLSDLMLFPNLKELYLHRNGISDISDLASLTKLEGLELSGNEIEDLWPLYDLTELKTLSLTYNQVSDLSPLENLSQLRRLYLMGNAVRDLSPLSGLTELRELDLRSNPDIADLSPLTALTQLESYAGPEQPWPADTGAIVLGIFPEDADPALLEAFNTAMSRMEVQIFASMPMDAENSTQVWKYFLDNDTQSTKPDAICLMPTADTDYSETQARAVQNGSALHMLTQTTPEGIFDEVCALYGRTDIENPYR